METVAGHTQGLKANQLKQLQKLYEQRHASSSWVSPEFAQQLGEIAQAIARPVCCYLDRRGQVLKVAVGSPAQTQLPPEAMPRRGADRLSGARCLAVQSHPPDTADLVALVRQRLDGLVVLIPAEKKGQRILEAAYLAHLVPDVDQPWEMAGPLPLDQLLQEDFEDQIHDWEADLRDSGFDPTGFQVTQAGPDRVLLVGLMTDDMTQQQFTDGLEELTRLVESAGGEVVGTVQQKRSQPHPQTVVGQGKVEEIALAAQTNRANLVVFDRDLSASQTRNLEEQITLRVVDRTGVILDIFAQRAQSQAGKLQVELAQMEYLLPRLRGRGQAMSRLGGGIGTRGPGETKLETERRTIQRRINLLQQEVNQLQAHRARLRHQREQQAVPVIALVGYTNAGKSTLLNTLTQAEVYVANQLFATLDPTTRRLSLEDAELQQRQDVLLTDTVGFIHHLPPPLVDAFRATLEEVTEANALVHLVDLSHPAWESHIQSVEEVLNDLPAMPGPALLVFNKTDQVESEQLGIAQQTYPEALFISATQRLGLETLRQRMLQLVRQTSPV
ncbi:MAG: GTPase HflX [Cyanobacteria bacterium Co-bin13]|nr:GTPase HflX [Cyanobacteria bacterium Co-bin13]